MTSNTNQNISHTTLAIRFIKILKCSNDNHILTIESPDLMNFTINYN